jgi:hypothetical protein
VDAYLYVSGDPVNKVDPMGLYQSDIHYYMTFFLAMAAGLDYESARIIALADQYIDNNRDTEALDESNILTKALSITWNQDNLAKYHFVLWQTGSDGKPVFDTSTDVANPMSFQLDDLLNASQKAPTKCGRFQLLGEYLHAFADTFAHRMADNTPFGVNNGFGHGLSGSEPDYTYNSDTTGVDLTDPYIRSRLWLTRESRTLEMEKEVFEKLQGYGDSGKAKNWSEIESIVTKFNVEPEQEKKGQNTADFEQKINVLNNALSTLGITGPDGKAINLAGIDDQYDATKAASNRNKYLCDANGVRLKQEDYPGTTLPKSACP